MSKDAVLGSMPRGYLILVDGLLPTLGMYFHFFNKSNHVLEHLKESATINRQHSMGDNRLRNEVPNVTNS